jgi:hypothetical protein
VLEDLTVHLEGKDIMKEMKFIILEQKFLEHIYAGKTFQALKVLQLEIRSELQKRVTILRIQNPVLGSTYPYCTVRTCKSGIILCTKVELQMFTNAAIYVVEVSTNDQCFVA